MANIYLTQAEIDQIRAARDARPAGSKENYTAIYRLIGDMLDRHDGAGQSDITNWFRGAEQVNGGAGAYSAFIRAYTKRQMTLRGIGHLYSDAKMQDASDLIAVRAVNDILDETLRKQPDGTWRFPTIEELALTDATAVGAVLFNSLSAGDSALENQQNAAWAGTVLFASLGSLQSSRLTANAGSAGFDRLEDMKNVLFAFDAMAAAAQAIADLVLSGKYTMAQIATDIGIGFWTGVSEPGQLVDIGLRNLVAQLPASARPFGELIGKCGVSSVLDWIEASLKGNPVAASGADIGARAAGVFASLSVANQRGWEVSLLPASAGQIVALAKSDAAVRNALLGLSPIVIVKSSYNGDTSLYNPDTGAGALSEEWLKDRAEFLQWNRLYKEDGQTDGVFDMPGGLPAPVQGDLRFMDMESGYQLKVDGLDGWVVPEKRIAFGGSKGDRLTGADGDDRMYGGQGNDQLYGGAGDDYLEGGADNDTLDGGEGQDRLLGGAGNDTLTGGAGSDVLTGGLGHDTYVYSSGDGNDTIVDKDGRIVFDGAGLTGGLRKKGQTVYRSRDGKHEFQWWGGDLVIDGTIIVKDFKNGNLGIYLDQESEKKPPAPPPPYDPNRSRRRIDPLAFDLNGNGRIDTVGSNESTAYFDFDGNSVAERTGWIADGDGLLALDANRNGAIDNLAELFGTADVDGFADLKRRVDSNGDNIVDARDARFADLLMWRDRNGDGIAQAGELSTLAELGIESINLAATPANVWSADNRISATSQFRRDGKLGLVGDVEFAVNFAITDSNPTRALDQDMEFDDEVHALPWLRGFGQVKNLNHAYQDDLALRQAARELAAGDSRSIIAGFEAFLVQWTGLAAAHARAGVVHGAASTEDKIWMLETLTGQNTNKTAIERARFGALDMGTTAAWDLVYIDEHYQNVMLRAGTAFAMQAAAGSWLQGAFYSLEQDRFVVVDAEQLQAGLETVLGSLASQADAEFAAIALLRLKTDGIEMAEDRLRQVLAASPYALAVLAALDANVSDFGNVDWALTDAYADAAERTDAAFLLGSGRADRLVGSSGDDTLAGHAGDDRLEGGDGNDTYLYSAGDGRDTISEGSGTWSSGGSDTIRFGPGIVPAMVGFRRAGQDLVLDFAGSDGQLTIAGWGGAAAAQVERFEFADGTVWDAAMLAEFVRATAPVGTAGADTLSSWNAVDEVLRGFGGDDLLQGGAGNDTLDGGTGNDYLYGNSGNDTYVFRRGDGQDTIAEWGGWGDSNDTISFGPGIAAADIVVSREGSDLVFSIAGTGDRLRVASWGDSDWLRIENVVFEDGMVWNGAHLQALVEGLALSGTEASDRLRAWNGVDDVLRGFAGDDSLQGNSGSDTFDGGAGNDTMQDSSGTADTYLFGRGGGQDMIYDYSYNYYYGQYQSDTIRFGENIVAADIVLSREGTGLVFTIGGTQDRIKVLEWGRDDAYRIEQVQFADGSVWDAAELKARVTALGQFSHLGGAGADTLYGWSGIDETLQGFGGNDVLYGADGNDTLVGGTGDDWLQGGDGADTYVFARGDGKDTIYDQSYSAGAGSTARLGPGIAESDIAMVREQDDILIRIGDGSDQLRISGWGRNSANGIERLVFDSGAVWDAARLAAELAALAIVGTDGADSLYGGDRTDTLIGGAGNDYLDGGAGSDVYRFERGDGQDTIREYDSSPNQDTIRFGSGIAAADIAIARVGNDLVFSIAGGEDRITLANWVYGNAYRIERVEFADGGAWENEELLARIAAVPYVGGDADDYLSGDEQGNILAGGRGADILQGGGGGDVYVFERGDGADTIHEWATGAGQTDILRFGAGIAADEVTLRRDGGSIVFAIAGGTDSVTVQSWIGGEANQIERVEFADGTIWDQACLGERIAQLPYAGGAGSDWLTGDATGNLFDGAAGNDYLSGRKGNDVYLFRRGDGQDTIDEQDASEEDVDTIRFGTSISAADIAFSRNRSGDIVLSVAGGYDQLTLRNWQPGGRNQIERIEFADGTSWDMAYLAQRIHAAPFVGTSGNDYLYGTSGDNTLAGAGGDDQLHGGEGNDTYLFDRKDGQDTITETGAGTDTIRFGAGIAAADIVLSREGNDLVLALAGTGDRVAVRSWRYGASYRIERVEFADGTAWDAATLAALVAAIPLVGTNGDDYLGGDSGDNTLDGGMGKDQLLGGDGGDTYLFRRGDGQDTISESGYAGADTIRFGAGIAAADIVMSRAGAGLVLAIAGTDDSITVGNWSYGEYYRIEQVVFADGTVWDAAALAGMYAALPLLGTEGDDYLDGDEGGNILDGGAGNDTLSGGWGSDTYFFELGDGQDRIQENGYDTDTIRFGAGIAAADIVLSREGNDLVLAIAGTGDRITVGNWNYGEYYRIEQVVFADGTVWDAAALAGMYAALPLLGTEGDDYLGGGDGDNILDGGAGNDTLSGGWGSDTYVFELGDGQDRIQENGYDTDTIRFGAGIAAADIVLSREGNDLVLAIAGTGDRITVGNWNYGEYYRIEQVAFADGTVWDAATLLAMSSALPLLGTDDDDYLGGDEGENTFDGGAGNDTLSGGWGSDTYVFELGDGQDRIQENGYDTDTIRFGAGIGAADIVVSRMGGDVVFAIAGTEDRIAVADWGNVAIERIEFADGVAWDAEQILGMVSVLPIIGTAGVDYLYGDAGDNLIEGGAGDDYLGGGEGADTYVFRRGDGHDTLYDTGYGFWQQDTIRFGEGIAEGDVSVSRNGVNLVFGIDGSDDRIEVANWQYGEYYRIERVEFADGTVWDAQTIAERIGGTRLVGSDGDDILVGDSGNNVLVGGAGDDQLEGDEGNDVYVYELGDGNDTIQDRDFNDGNIDIIRFGAGIAASDVGVSRTGTDLVLTIGSTGETITVELFGAGKYFAVERVEFDDGTVWDPAYLLQRLSGAPQVGSDEAGRLDAWAGMDETLLGMGGDDYLAGEDGNDTLDGGTGNDYLYGRDGSDTYVFRRGDGQDTIYDYDWDGGDTDTIRLGEGIAGADLRFSRDGADLVIAIGQDGDSLRVENWGNQAGHRIERIEFADGSVWDAAFVAQQVGGEIRGTGQADVLEAWSGRDETLRGLGGDDTLSGADGDDLLEGGAGDDYLAGGEGSDTYVFNLGDGRDTIGERGYRPDAVDTLRFGPGIAAQEITVTRNGLDMVLSLAGGSDGVTLAAWGDSAAAHIERVEFADGSAWSKDELMRRMVAAPIVGSDEADILQGWDGIHETLRGLAGDDTLEGGTGEDLLEGGVGGDWLRGREGGDTYLFGRGDGQDFIEETDNRERAADTIRFGTGIAPSEVSFSRSGSDLVLHIGADGDTITVVGWGWDESRQIERIAFDDGTVWAGAEIAARIPAEPLVGTSDAEMLSGWAGVDDAMAGLDGDDTLWGMSGDDTLEGGAGNDVLGGGEGHDVYLFGVGDGQDVIAENGVEDDVDTIRFGAGIASSDLAFAQAGADLVITVGDGGDAVTIERWGESEANQVERIEFADGSVWDAAAIRQRISAIDARGSDGNDYLEGWAGTDDSLHGAEGIDVLRAYSGADTLEGGAGNDFLDGGNGEDLLIGGSGNDLLIGGGGDDSIDAGDGRDIILFNRGDGRDTVRSGAQGGATVSLGGGIEAADLLFSRSGDDLVLSAGGGEGITFRDWYAQAGSRGIANLQMVTEGAEFHAPGIEQFDFAGLVARFDKASLADPGLGSWALSSSLLDFYLHGGSDTALGGEISVEYGTNGKNAYLPLESTQALLSKPEFGTARQDVSTPIIL